MSRRRAFDPKSVRGSVDARWKETVWRAASRFPKPVREGLIVDWTDSPLNGGAAYTGSRLLVGWDPSGYNPKHAIEHELAHRMFGMLPKESRDAAGKVFSKWTIGTEIAKTYRTAEGSGTWQRDDPRYTDMLTVRKRVQEQAAEALRATVMREPLPRQAKAWAANAVKAVGRKSSGGDGDVQVSAHERDGHPVGDYTRRKPSR